MVDIKFENHDKEEKLPKKWGYLNPLLLSTNLAIILGLNKDLLYIYVHQDGEEDQGNQGHSQEKDQCNQGLIHHPRAYRPKSKGGSQISPRHPRRFSSGRLVVVEKDSKKGPTPSLKSWECPVS